MRALKMFCQESLPRSFFIKAKALGSCQRDQDAAFSNCGDAFGDDEADAAVKDGLQA